MVWNFVFCSSLSEAWKVSSFRQAVFMASIMTASRCRFVFDYFLIGT